MLIEATLRMEFSTVSQPSLVSPVCGRLQACLIACESYGSEIGYGRQKCRASSSLVLVTRDATRLKWQMIVSSSAESRVILEHSK